MALAEAPELSSWDPARPSVRARALAGRGRGASGTGGRRPGAGARGTTCASRVPLAPWAPNPAREASGGRPRGHGRRPGLPRARLALSPGGGGVAFFPSSQSVCTGRRESAGCLSRIKKTGSRTFVSGCWNQGATFTRWSSGAAGRPNPACSAGPTFLRHSCASEDWAG